jgi:hypothetical protein
MAASASRSRLWFRDQLDDFLQRIRIIDVRCAVGRARVLRRHQFLYRSGYAIWPLSGRENHIQKSPHVRTLSDYPVGFPASHGNGRRARCRRSHDELSSGYNADRGHCFLWYAIGDDLRNRRNPDFALTSTLPTCEPEVDRADSTMHRIYRPAPAPGGCGGRDRAATCHPLDRCTFKEMSDDKYPGQNWLLLPKCQRRKISRWG